MKYHFQKPALLLAALLQVLPVVRTICSNPATASTFAIILRWTIGSTAALSAVDAVSGATTVFTSPATFSGTVGTPFSNNVVVSIGGGNKAAKDDYFILSGTATSPLLLNGQSTTVTLPPGLTFQASWVNGAATIGGIIYGTPTTAGSYPTTVTVVSPGNASLGQKITLTITASTGPTAPAITSPPAAATVVAGKTATFTVACSGTAPIGYFWSKGGAPLANGGSLSGANTATLTISNVLAGDAGNYSVLVSNSVSTAASAAAALTVIVPPAITSQPAGLNAATGGSAQFTVTASGTAPLSYRWLNGGVTIANGVKYSGVNSNILTIAAITAADAGNYSVAVTNLGGSITSSVAALTVVALPTIVTPPASQTVVAGASASFTVAAAGSTPLVYRWLKNTAPLADGGNVSGSATATLTLTGVSSGDAANYSVNVSNSLGTVTSSAATLTVAIPPAIVTPPAAVTVLTGSNASFTVTASGTAPLAYQWLKNGTPISGATLATLALLNVSAADVANYSVTVTNSVGSITSGSAALTVLAPPAITTQPTSTTVAVGSSASFTTTASGTAPLTFQWLKNGIVIPGANSNILTLATVTTNDAGNYSVTVTNAAGNAASSSASLTVLVLPAITTQPLSATVIAGTNVTFTVTASGTATLTYQWLKNGTPLPNGGNVSGATTASLALSGVSASDAANYSVTVTNTLGSATSGIAVLTVLGPPAITTQPANATVALGNSASFSVTASGTAPLTFQWLKNGLAIPGAGSSVLTLVNVTTNDAANYSVTVTNVAGSATSSSASLTVLVLPVITSQPLSVTAVAGTNVTFTVTASSTATLTYQWLKNGTPLPNGGNVSGATTASLALSGVTASDAANYSVTVTNTLGSATSGIAVLTVLGPPTITSQPVNATVALGNSASFSVTAGGTAPLTFKWLKNGIVIPGATSNVFTLVNVTTNDAANYSVTVTNVAGSATSSPASLTVLVPPAINIQPLSATAVAGTNVTFTVAATGSPTLTYQWRKNGNGLANGGNISGATSASLSLVNVSAADTASYSVVVTNTVGSATSGSAVLTVLGPPAISSQPTNVTVALGNPASFSVTAGGTGPLNFQWMKNGIAIPGANSNVLAFSAVTTNNAATYFVVVTNTVGNVSSFSATLTVLVPPAIVTQPVNASVTAGTNVTFTVTATGSPTLTYQWRKDGVNISGATAAALTLTSVSTSDAAGYSVVVSNAVGGVTSSGALLTVLLPPAIITQPANQVAALGNTIALAVEASGTGPLSYQWFKGGSGLVDGGNLSGSTSNILTIATLTTNDVNTYFVVVSNLLGSATSTNASVTITNTGGNAPLIIAQPADLVAPPNKTVVLSVTVTGPGPLVYQWRKNGVKLANGKNISGATTPSLTLANVKANNNGTYSVAVANPHGSTNSAAAKLMVQAPPVIVKSPVSRTVKAGATVTLKVKAKGGAPLSYQWFKNSTALVNGGNVSGSTGTVLKLSALTSADTAIYSVVVSNLAGRVTSGNALLTVLLPSDANGVKAISSVASPSSPVVANVSVPVVPPVISQIFKNANGGITLNCIGTPDSTYLLQATFNLTDWTTISTNTADASGLWQVTDDAGAPSRFYRIQTAP